MAVGRRPVVGKHNLALLKSWGPVHGGLEDFEEQTEEMLVISRRRLSAHTQTIESMEVESISGDTGRGPELV